MRARVLLYGILVVQILGFSLGYGTLSRETGPRYRIRVAAVDPRDLLRGDYVRLRPDIAAMPDGSPMPETGSVWVELEPADGIWTVRRVVRDRMDSDGPWLRARWDGSRLIYGIEKYFIPEGSGNPAAGEWMLEVTVSRSGRAVPRQFFVNGAAWP